MTFKEGCSNAPILSMNIFDELSPVDKSDKSLDFLDKPKKKVKDLHKQVKLEKLGIPKWPPLQDVVILGFDTEYEVSADGSHNKVLCYTYSISHKSKVTTGYIDIIRNKRIKFDKFVAQCIETAIEDGTLDSFPTHLYLCAHFLKADIFHFKDVFQGVGAYLSSMRKTVVTRDKYYGVDIERAFNKRIDNKPLKVYTKSRNQKKVYLKFVDTMLLAPNGKALSDIGGIVGLDKLEIEDGYSIERMSQYKKEQFERFKLYAIRDSEIARKYVELMIQFCIDNGLSSLPATIGAIAVKLFIQWLENRRNLSQQFGYEIESHTDWNHVKGSVRTIKKRIPCLNRRIYEEIAILGYHGGRNESFWMGVTPVEEYYDLDLPSCYTACMVGVREIDYDSASEVHHIEELLGDICSIAIIEFRFPNDTLFPCLPVRMDSGLVFPLSGQSICTGHEIEAALNQDAHIIIKKGFVFPWKNDDRIFELFVKKVRDNRSAHPKGSFNELMFKEIGNSLYGKTAQGLRSKNGFDVETGLSKPLPYTSLTNPFYSAYTTGLARAVLGEILAAIPAKYKVISVTTDGFITTAPLSEIPLDGPICQRFRSHYHRIATSDNDGSLGEILELKHGAKQLISIKTRGQVTLQSSDNPDTSIILAKAGVRPPRNVDDHNHYMIKTYKERTSDSMTDASFLTSTRAMYLERRDMVTEKDAHGKKKEQRLNLEFDFKRLPVSAEMISIPKIGDIDVWSHLGCPTVPFKTLEDINFARTVFKGFRVNHCLTTIEDFESFQDYHAMKLAKHNKIGLAIQEGEQSDNLLIRLFIRHYMNSSLGLSADEMNASELSRWLESIGYPIKASTLRSAKRAALLQGCLPRTPRTERCLKLIKNRFPDADLSSLFAEQ